MLPSRTLPSIEVYIFIYIMYKFAVIKPKLNTADLTFSRLRWGSDVWMFFCKKIFTVEMLGKFSDMLHTAVDVIAPPPTPVQEFEYHWKQLKKFYSVDGDIPKLHVNNTNLPYHLDYMLQMLIKESEEDVIDENAERCIDYVLANKLIDLLVELCVSDTPPGVRVHILNWLRRYLSCVREPPLYNRNLYQPIQRVFSVCNGKNPSPYEEEEILFLETVAGLVRKDRFLVNIFLSSHQHSAHVSQMMEKIKVRKIPTKNPLFEYTKLERNISRVEIVSESTNSDLDDSSQETPNEATCDIEKESSRSTEKDDLLVMKCDCEIDDRFPLMDIILTYFESPDSRVVVRACESALILSSLPDLNLGCKALLGSLSNYTSFLIFKLTSLCERVPEDIDPGDIEDSSVSWGLIPHEKDSNNFPGRAQLHEFLCWLDYTDCVSRECPYLSSLHSKFRNDFLLGFLEPALVATDTPFVLALMAKIIKQIRSTSIMDEISTWLIGGEADSDVYMRNDCLLSILIENAQDNNETLVSALQFVEALLDNPHEKILHELVFRYINKRGYYDYSCKGSQSWSDEEDERERRRGSVEERIKSRTMAPHNILKIINSFLLLIPRQIMVDSTGTCYEEYVQDASRHYKIWIKKTAHFSWPIEAVSIEKEETSPKCSESSFLRRSGSRESREGQCNDSGISEESFYEGPLLKLLFSHVRNMAQQSCEINLAVIAILSKLAFLPHPYLHEILLNPEIPVAHGASTLWSSMQVLSKHLLLEIPKRENFQKRIGEIGKRLLSNPPVLCDNCDEFEPLFEAIVVLEEFCKELAAIAFVKYHHATE